MKHQPAKTYLVFVCTALLAFLSGEGYARAQERVLYVAKQELTAKDSQLGGGKRYKVFPIKMNAGTTYKIRLQSTDFDTYLYLLDGKGTVAKNDDIGKGDRNSEIVYKAPADAIYRAVATSFEPNKTGWFVISVTADTPAVAKKDPPSNPSPKDPPPPGAGQRVLLDEAGELTAADKKLNNKHYKTYTLSMSAGTTYTIDLTSTFDTYLYLLDAKSIVAQNDDVKAGNLNSRIVYKPSVNGTYRVIATSLRPAITGKYRIRVTADGPAVVAKKDPDPVRPTPGGPVLDVAQQLTKQDPQSLGRHYKYFPVGLTAGTTYTIEMTSGDFDTYLKLLDAKGIVAQNDDGGFKTDSKIVYRASASGSYRVMATSFKPGDTGRFRLTVSAGGPTVVAKTDPKKPVDPGKPVVDPRPKNLPKVDLTKVHPKVRQAIQALQAKVAPGGNLNLGTINAALGGLTLESPRFNDDGSVTGSIGYKNQRMSGYFQYFPGDGNTPQWTLALRFPDFTRKLTQLAALGAFGAILDGELDVKAPIIMVSTTEAEIESSDMSPAMRSFFGSLTREADFTLSIAPGVRVRTAGSFATGSKIAAFMKKLNFTAPEVAFEGVLLSELSPNVLLKLADGSLKNDLSIKASISDFKLGKMPRGWATSGAFVQVTAEPSISVGFDLAIPLKDGTKKKFTAKLRVAKGSEATEVAFVATTDGLWRRAFGIDFLDLDRVALVLGVDTAHNLAVGVQGRYSITVPPSSGYKGLTKTFDMAGKLKINLESGIPTEIAFRAGSEKYPLSLDRDEVLLLTNHLVQAVKPGSRRIGRGNLPDFEIKKFFFSFAPKGGDEDLEIPDGIAMSGQFFFNKRELASIEGKINIASTSPELRLKAKLANLDIPDSRGLKIRNVNVDIQLTTAEFLDNHFKVSGSVEILGSKKSVEISMALDRFYFRFQDRINGVFDSDVLCDLKTREGTWRFEAKVKSELDKIARQASDEVKKWAQNANQDFIKAKAKLDAEQRKINSLNTKLAKERADAKRDYDRVKNELASWNRKIAAQQREINKLPGFLRGPAREVLNVINRGFAEFRKGAGWALNAVGPDAHPEVIKLQADIKLATAGLQTAKLVVEGTRVATTESAKALAYGLNNPPISVQGMVIKGNASVKSLGSASLQVTVSYRYLGNARIFNATLNGRDLTPNGIADRLAKAVIK